MAYDEGLAERIREILDSRDDVTERKMFSGLAFVLFCKLQVGLSGSSAGLSIALVHDLSRLRQGAACLIVITRRTHHRRHCEAA